MTIQIKDLTGCQQIDLSAVRGGVRVAEGGDSIDLSADLSYNAYVNDRIVGAVAQGPVAIVAAAASIAL
jgi:hypothetical protein